MLLNGCQLMRTIYARVEHKYSRLPSIDEDYYARVEQEHS